MDGRKCVSLSINSLLTIMSRHTVPTATKIAMCSTNLFLNIKEFMVSAQSTITLTSKKINHQGFITFFEIGFLIVYCIFWFGTNVNV